MVDKELKAIGNFITAGNILVIVSIFKAGVPLSALAIVCALVARVKFKKLLQNHNLDASTQTFYAKKILSVTILSIILFIINAISAWMMYPYVVDYMNQLLGQYSGIQGASSVPNNGSIWG